MSSEEKGNNSAIFVETVQMHVRVFGVCMCSCRYVPACEAWTVHDPDDAPVKNHNTPD